MVKPTDSPLWQAASPRPRAIWVLPAPLLPTAMTFSRRWMYSQRASSMTRALFTEGMTVKSKVSQALDGREAGRLDPALHHALVAVDEFQFCQTQQVPRMVHTLGGALGGHLSVFPEEGGQLQLLQMMFQEQRGAVAHTALPDSNVM